MQALSVGIAIIVGIALGYWLGIRQARSSERTLAEVEVREAGLKTQLEAAAAEIKELRPKSEALAVSRQQFEDEKAKYAQMKADLDTAFHGAAAEALRQNSESFLVLAKRELSGQVEEADKALEARQTAIKSLVDPLKETLSKLDEQTREMEKERSGAYTEVKTLVESMQKSIPTSLDALKIETSQLISALRAPKTRGNWGELQLKRCVEFAGMVQYCSFSEQVSARDDEDRILRPDMIIQLPNGREIVVDAKTPLDAFLDAVANDDGSAQKIRFLAHAQRVKAHLKELSGKGYWRQFDKAPDFVVCFLPSEALFSAALEADPSLIEFSAETNVVIATPTTLIALLRAVEFGWQQSEITKNAKLIYGLGRKVYEKLVVAQGHVTKLGNAIANSVDYYNKFLGTVEGRGSVFFLGRQLGDLVHSDAEMVEVKRLPMDLREVESEEWAQPSLSIAAGADEMEESRHTPANGVTS
ncbi:MAG: DNA recombination protein RmuC [Terracidiphilus sp.]